MPAAPKRKVTKNIVNINCGLLNGCFLDINGVFSGWNYSGFLFFSFR